MPIYQLPAEPLFPPAEWSNPDGLLAVGGDLTPERLIEAYSSGIFPWYSRPDPILWWSPDPRFVLFPGELHIPKSARRTLNSNVYRIRVDTSFSEVIHACSLPRPYERGSWITPDMEKAYIRLHGLGLAHSIEAWQDNELCGGLYGVCLGRIFFGESMFTRRDNASKTALIRLVQRMRNAGFMLLDSQVPTPHVERLGGRSIPRAEYLEILKEAVTHPTITDLSIFADPD